MSQKSILSFFKQAPVPSASKETDKQNTPEKVNVKEKCYDDSPIKQPKRKRLKRMVESDEDESSCSDEDPTKKSKAKGKQEKNKLNGDSDVKPKAKRAKIGRSLNSSQSEKSLTNGSTEKQNKCKKPAQLLSDEEDAPSESEEKKNVDEVTQNGKSEASLSTLEDKVTTNKSETNSPNTSVDFIPKRKTARKQMRGQQWKKDISKAVEESTPSNTKVESTVTALNDDGKTDNNQTKETSDPQSEKMEIDQSDSDHEINSKNNSKVEKLSDDSEAVEKKGKGIKKTTSKTNISKSSDDSEAVEKEKKGIKKTTPKSNKSKSSDDSEALGKGIEKTTPKTNKRKSSKPNNKTQSPQADVNSKNSKSSVSKKAKHSKNDSQQNDVNSDNTGSSEDQINKEETSETEDKIPANSEKKKTHPFFTPKRNESDSPKKEVSTKNVNTSLQSSTSSKDAYNPSKSHYHPIDDACWKRNEKVPYLGLAKTLEYIESTSARLQMIEILSNFLRSVMVLTPEDLLYCVYLCLNRLAPEYEGIELGVGEMLLMKAVAQATGRTVDKIKAEVAVKGDLGLVAESSRGSQRLMFAPPKLTVCSVFTKFKEIAKMSGNTVMSKKTDKIQALFVACRDCEAKYIIRSLSGKLRIGLAEQSILAALARAAVLTPPNQSYPPEMIDKSSKMSAENFKKYLTAQTLILRTTYCECPNFDLVIPVLLKEGIEALPEHCQLCPGCPLKPMLAHPTNGIEEVLNRFDKTEFTCEYKYDGERAQIHMNDKGEVKIFSRNQEDNTSKYPDVISRISKALKDSTKTFILDTEAVAWDPKTKQILPFQVLSTRKKKDAVEADIVVQVCIMAFDLLYINGESLVKKPLKERRELLHSSFVQIPNEFVFANYIDNDSAEAMQQFLDESITDSCEGLMVKALTVDASYEIAKRSRNWLKLKKDYLDGAGDSLDLCVIGGYHGKGKRTGTYGGFLLACYDEENEEFQSICKLGTGFSEDELDAHTKFLKNHVIKSPKSYYRYNESLEPDEWFDAVQIWEIKCADLSISPVHKAAQGIVDPEKGISLRFPRFLRIRDDKTKPEDCTLATQVAEMYQRQKQIQNTKSTNAVPDEDYY